MQKSISKLLQKILPVAPFHLAPDYRWEKKTFFIFSNYFSDLTVHLGMTKTVFSTEFLIFSIVLRFLSMNGMRMIELKIFPLYLK